MMCRFLSFVKKPFKEDSFTSLEDAFSPLEEIIVSQPNRRLPAGLRVAMNRIRVNSVDPDGKIEKEPIEISVTANALPKFNAGIELFVTKYTKTQDQRLSRTSEKRSFFPASFFQEEGLHPIDVAFPSLARGEKHIFPVR